MFNFTIDEHKYNHVHFIGIGGISMSALAKILVNEKYIVSGSDSKKSKITTDLEDLGVKLFYGHHPDNVLGADLVIYTDAINMENLELKSAIANKIDLVDRATFLGALMKTYDISIAISGTHGKTSTTSMLSKILLDTNLEPTIMVGGNLDDIGGNIKIGNKKIFLTEACEYKANILKYFPNTAVILNVDEDHLDYFDNIDHIIKTFKGYVKNLNPSDNLILNVDDENTKILSDSAKCNIYSVSIKDENADFYATNIGFNNGLPFYDLYIKNEFVGKVELSVMGVHNISNSLCAIAASYINGIDINTCISQIKLYHGVHRRLEYKGDYNGITIIDDYAHHPTEIQATLSALNKACKGNLYCIFQPHTFTRTKLLLDSFSKSFSNAKSIIITDIYAAREKDYGDIHSKTLVEAISKNGDNAKYIKTFEEIVEYIKLNAKPNDTVVTMGAGDVYLIGETIINEKKDTDN